MTLDEMKALKVGDRVIHPISGESGQVIAIWKDQIRVKWRWSGDGGAMFDPKVADCIRKA